MTTAVCLPEVALAGDDDERAAIATLEQLLRASQRQLEREIGTPLEFAAPPAPVGARPAWLIGPARLNRRLASLGRPAADGPQLHVERAAGRLICDAPDVAGIYETLDLLFSLHRLPDGCYPVHDCAGVDDAIETIRSGVAETWPSFALHGLDWDAICSRHVDRVAAAREPMAAAQAWLAELGDAHTWVRPRARRGQLPYEARVDGDRLVLWQVPTDSAAWRAGARPGAEVLGRDPQGWYQRTAATPQQRPLLAGRRALEGDVGETLELEARSPSGKLITWRESVPTWPFAAPLSWRRLASGNGYLRIHAFLAGHQLDEQIDEALSALAGAPGLIVDLRGNGGGDQALAHAFRARFLSRARTVGSIRYRIPDGDLSPPEPLTATPAEPARRWTKPVRFLTDPLTYSAAEDALLGLEQEACVEMIGEATGGGSGRVRSLRLLEGWKLTITTCHTFTIAGRCVEGHGLPVDVVVETDRKSPADDRCLAVADARGC